MTRPPWDSAKEWEKRLSLCRTSFAVFMLGIVLVGLLFLASIKRTGDSGHVLYMPLIYIGLGIIHFLVLWRNWRCPHCGKSLGRASFLFSVPTFCPHCGRKLAGDD